MNKINQNLTTTYFICFKTTAFFHISNKIPVPKLCYLVLDPKKMQGFSELHYTVPKLLLLDLTDNKKSVICVIQ